MPLTGAQPSLNQRTTNMHLTCIEAYSTPPGLEGEISHVRPLSKRKEVVTSDRATW